ncbi:MAG: ATP-binding protein [Bradymonadaceae bacterium]
MTALAFERVPVDNRFDRCSNSGKVCRRDWQFALFVGPTGPLAALGQSHSSLGRCPAIAILYPRLHDRTVVPDASTEHQRSRSDDGDRTFLVVDDEPDILDSIERLFRRQYRVLTAQTAAEGRDLVESEDVQVVMSDQRMPDTTGIDFLAELRESHPEIVRVLLTGYSDIDNVIDAINEGHVYRYISKPWKPSELKLFVRQAFEYYESERERDRLLAQLREANEKLEEQNRLLSHSNAELKQLDRMKDVFMEVVSHELNTPVAATVGYTHLLRRELGEDLPASIDKALSGIDSSAMRLKRITSRIFKMLSEEGPTSTLTLDTIELPTFIEALRERIEPFLDKRDQTLDVEIDADTDLVADREKLRDVFLNLLMNAVKFSRDGQTISLRVRSASDGEEIAFAVEDRGVGIDEEDRSKIFDAFFSTFDSKHHSSGDFGFEKRGIGLGLSVAQKFTEMHGGRIEVESETGEGSRFTVHLPLEPEHEGVSVDADPAAADSLLDSQVPDPSSLEF